MNSNLQVFGGKICFNADWDYYSHAAGSYPVLAKDLNTLCEARKVSCDLGACSACKARLGVRYLVNCTRCQAEISASVLCFKCDEEIWADSPICRGCTL